MGSSHNNRQSSNVQSFPNSSKKKGEMQVFFLLLMCWLPSLITAREGREPARLVKCEKLESTLLTGDYEETSLSAVGGDESGCVRACQLDKECAGASIDRRRTCQLYKKGYGIQKSGRGMRAWTSYTCCRGRGCRKRNPGSRVKCQKVSSTGFHGHYAQVDVGRDETACVESCQDDKECVAASIGSRGRPCYLYKAGYGEQTSGRGRRGWTSYTCCRGRGCPRG